MKVSTNSIDWAQALKPGDHVVASHMSSEPSKLLGSLAAQGVDFPLTLDLGVPFTMAPDALSTNVRLEVMGGMGTARQLAKTHAMQVNRLGYRDIVASYRDGERTADVVLVSLARQADGELCVGASHGVALDAARSARTIIAEVNARMPAICGAPWPSELKPAVLLETDYALPSPPVREPSEREKAIAEHLAPLVPNGACIEVGIGTMPSAVLQALAGHRHLGIHSGMFTDAMVELLSAGVIDHSQKPKEWQFACIGGAYGDKSLYDLVAENSLIRLCHTDITHGPEILASLPMFTAINSAIEVDLLGQANAETSAGPGGARRQPGGIGGLQDFANGGLASEGGRSVIALSARTRDDESGHARIVPRLTHEVTLDEQQADTVVTEYGVAELRGLSRQARVEQMIQVAHPNDRDALRYQANAMGLTV
ncbi:MAG: acetyl-CoA hydrolase/transferase family protein [Burkholderiaceae bacterium]